MKHWIPYPLLSFNFSTPEGIDLHSIEYCVHEGICLGGIYQVKSERWGWFLAGKRPPTPHSQEQMFISKSEAREFIENYNPEATE